MNYYLIDTAIEKGSEDSEVKTQAISVYGDPEKTDEENRNAALIQFHNTIAYKMQIATVKSALVMIVNEYGSVEKSEKYDAYVAPEPNPEPEE